jgi:hypothetical protein
MHLDLLYQTMAKHNVSWVAEEAIRHLRAMPSFSVKEARLDHNGYTSSETHTDEHLQHCRKIIEQVVRFAIAFLGAEAHQMIKRAVNERQPRRTLWYQYDAYQTVILTDILSVLRKVSRTQMSTLHLFDCAKDIVAEMYAEEAKPLQREFVNVTKHAHSFCGEGGGQGYCTDTMILAVVNKVDDFWKRFCTLMGVDDMEGVLWRWRTKHPITPPTNVPRPVYHPCVWCGPEHGWDVYTDGESDDDDDGNPRLAGYIEWRMKPYMFQAYKIECMIAPKSW